MGGAQLTFTLSHGFKLGFIRRRKRGEKERYWRQGRECWGVEWGRERRDASQRVTVGDDDDDYWRPRYGLGVARLVSGRRMDLKRRFSERERISPSPTLVPLSRVLRAVENFSS